MNEIEYRNAAYKIAEETSQHLNQPTSPPQGWRLEGADLVVLLADGRKIRAPLPVVTKQVDKITALPVHKPAPRKPGRIK